MLTTAVILAGRKEFSFSIPAPLIKIHEDISLLSRTLSLLKECDISNIIIVTGFKKELFEDIPDVNLVYNDNYAYTASMASLAMASKYIKDDFLLIESDMIYEKTVLEALSTTKKKNCFSIASETGNGDEAFVETDGRFITKISKDLHQMNKIDGEMIGASKISLETYQKMLLKWKHNSNLRLNYEYLLLDCTEKHEREYIYFKNLIWGEIDTPKDLEYVMNYLYPKLRRKEDPFDFLNIVSHLKKIFPNKKIESSNLTIEQIGGMTNRNFKIILDQEQYVLRIPGNGTEELIERKNEETNSLLACKIEINPENIYFDEKFGIKLTKFIDGAETLNPTTVQRYENIIEIAAILKQLHTSKVRFNSDFNVFQEILKYEGLLKAYNGKMYEGYKSYRPKILSLSHRLNELGVVLRPCHNDLVAENFIKDSTKKIYLLDWEYSGTNDPMWDLAALFIESNFSEDNQKLTLEKYFGRTANDIEKEKIYIYQILMDILWSIWTCIKEAKGDDFGDYGTKRYNRAIDKLKRIKAQQNES